MKKIAVFASGNGSNFQRIVEYFENKDNIEISLLVVNKKDAFARERAKDLGIEHIYIGREEFYNSNILLDILKGKDINLIVLAGFLWLIPEYLIDNYTIINIHPALLPKYGGKGMYGDKVHNAVIENKEKESGITIHYVNNKYDKGEVIFQAKCEILPFDDANSLAEKIHALEHEYFPQIIEKLISES